MSKMSGLVEHHVFFSEPLECRSFAKKSPCLNLQIILTYTGVYDIHVCV